MKNSADRILEAINTPDMVQKGDAGTLLALKKFEETPVSDKKYLAAVYKEAQAGGFVLTAYYTNKPRNRVIIWKKH